MRKVGCICTLLLLCFFTLIWAESDFDHVIVNMKIQRAADIRKTDSQFTESYINDEEFEEMGHGTEASPVRVEYWKTTNYKYYAQEVKADWYSKDAGAYAFGYLYDGSYPWPFSALNPQDIEDGVYDSGGTKPTLKEGGSYIFIGNHTRFHIATNYNPEVQITAPEYLYNGNSKIKVKQLQIEYSDTKYGVIPGNHTKTVYQCSPGNYSTNQIAIYAVIEVSEEWWTLQSGDYVGTAILTLVP